MQMDSRERFPPQESVAEAESSRHSQSAFHKSPQSLCFFSLLFKTFSYAGQGCEAITLQKRFGGSQSSPDYHFATKSERLDFISGSLDRHKHRWSALTPLVCTCLMLSTPLFGCLRLCPFSQNFNFRQRRGH